MPCIYFQDFPGLDSLHKYDVSVDDQGQVRVRAKKSVAGGELICGSKWSVLVTFDGCKDFLGREKGRACRKATFQDFF